MADNAGNVELVVNGRSLRAAAGSTVAAALFAHDVLALRTSVRGERRGPLCGMGICHECRVTIDGIGQQRACLVQVADGMRVEIDG